MGAIILKIFRLFVLFGRNAAGCINQPYITYRKLSDEKTDSWQTIFILFLAVSYFAFASLIKVGVRNPFLLTVKFHTLFIAAIFGFFLVIFLIFLAGKIFSQKISLKVIFTLWSFSLLPTIIWFFTTSILYVILPPPRTFSIPGYSYSFLYIAFSLALLFWKLIFYYLTIRFSLRIDLIRIILASFIIFPPLFAYSLLMYKFGVFRIPFI